MTHGSLFSGIGGFDYAAGMMGWRNAFHCEINEFCSTILNYHFPDAEHYRDITKTDFNKWGGCIDVLTGGFPCQPFSVAGARKGADDDRYLWPQMLRAIREIRPTWVVGENVAGILTMVQPGEEVEVGNEASLFGEDNRKRIRLRQEYVVETICGNLEREGYSVQPFVIPACAVGAPHRRDRVWFVAHLADARAESLQCGGEDGVHAVRVASGSDRDRQRERSRQQVTVSGRKGASYDCACGEDGIAPIPSSQRRDNRGDNRGERYVCDNRERNVEEGKQERDEREHWACKDGETIADDKCCGRREIHEKVQPRQPDGEITYSDGNERFSPDTDSDGFQRECLPRKAKSERRENENGRFEEYSCSDWNALPAERWRDFPTQPPVCSRDDGISLGLDGITFSKWRQESIKAYGNAIVPQVAYEIFRAIEETYNNREK